MGELRLEHSLDNPKLRKIVIEKIRYFSHNEIYFSWTESELILKYSDKMSSSDIDQLRVITKVFLENNRSIERFFLKEAQIDIEKFERRITYKNWIKKHLNDLFQELHSFNLRTDDKIFAEVGIPMYQNEIIDFKKTINLLISKFAKYNYNAVSLETPTFLSMKNAQMAGYFDTGSQHMYFVSEVTKDFKNFQMYHSQVTNEEFKDVSNYLVDSGFVLTPAVCLHVYPALGGSDLPLDNDNPYFVYDVLGTAYRDEGTNLNDFDRFREFQVHELVFFGEEKALELVEEEVVDFMLALFDCLNITGHLEVANDIFFGNQEKNLLVNQILSKDKIEFVASKSEKSLASLNKHHCKFTNNFNIKSNKGSEIASMCLGFGIDRILNELILTKQGEL